MTALSSSVCLSFSGWNTGDYRCWILKLLHSSVQRWEVTWGPLFESKACSSLSSFRTLSKYIGVTSLELAVSL